MAGRSEALPLVSNKTGRFKRITSITLGSRFKVQIVFSILGFLMGRAVILDFLNPFSVAYLSTAVVQGINPFIIGTSILLGIVSLGQKELLLKYLFSAAVLIIIYFIIRNIKAEKKILVSVSGVAANFAAGYCIFYIRNYYLYDLLMIMVESCMIPMLVYIYDRTIPIIRNYKNRRLISSEEIAALSILAAFCFIGAEFVVGGLSLKNIFVILIIMLSAYLGSVGIGAAVGITMGIIQSLSGSILPAAVGVYGLCGLMCGVMKNLGRFGCPLGFILSNALMTFYINGSTEVMIRFYEILSASVIFMVLPRKLLKRLSGYKCLFDVEYLKDQSYSKRMKAYTIDKLNELSGVFKSLSETLGDRLQDNTYFSQADAAQLIDQVANKVCVGCGMKSSCWKRDFYKSYQYFFNLISIIENGSELNKHTVPQEFKERCLKSEDICANLGHHYDLFRNSLGWKKKMNESRHVVSDQLKEVSSVVASLASRIDMDVDFDREMEELIMVGLDSEAVRVKDVIVAKTGSTLDVDIRVNSCGGKRECIKNIIPLVNKITGRKFNKKDMACDLIQSNICSIKLKEAQRYQVATGIARTNKSGAVSGDNYSFIELKDGKFMLALSDGMGTGPKAAIESNMTITLLEKFLYAGFDKDIALKTINSMLLMKSNDETYSTIDLTIINQYTGEVEFVKVGAVSTFIKYAEDVSIIRTGSLPVGILDKIDMELVRKKLKDGDFVIMVTDGVLDCNKDVVDKEKWLADMIQKMNTRNPQKMAEDILNSCLELNGGIAPDDMTVLVAKIWETM
ncbi:MAG: stage II sporulation protein E [Caulobacteraceae bacterium]